MRINFGKYDVPPTLRTLIELEKELGEPENFYDGLHFYLALTDFRYFNTPSDVIVFGNTGADGIHYGFLTDYGSVPDLEEAPIVCVCPMDFDQPTRLIANNLREFLRINFTDDTLFYNHFVDGERYLSFKKEQQVEQASYPPSEQQLLNQVRIKNFLEENIQMPIIDNPYLYIQMIRIQRQEMITIKTQDGLGVVASLPVYKKHHSFEIHQDTKINLVALKAYFSTAPIPSQYATFRDIQLHYDLSNEPLLREVVLATMLNIGLIDEVKRLNSI